MAFAQAAVFPTWSVFLLAFWFALVGIQYALGWYARLGSGHRRMHSACAVLFPLFATTWKFVQQRYDLEQGGLPNRIQHLAWSAAMVGVLLPLLGRWWAGRSWWEPVLAAVAIVALLGNVTEVGEFLAKDRAQRTTYAYAYYRDTMIDSVMNMIGAASGAAGALVLWRRQRAATVGNR